MLKWLLPKRRRKKRKTGAPAYEKAREIAATGTIKQRKNLASYDDTAPEILYFFAKDDAPEVRRQVAENEATPLQADAILAEDSDVQVRRELAHKIGQLIPTLTEEENERLTEMAMQVLEVLAQDEEPQVRAIISEEIKLLTNVPKKVVRRLAKDVEAIVSSPILEFSPLLTENELIQIIAGGVQGGALAAIARREGLAHEVSDAIVMAEDKPAVTSLLENETAAISEKTMDVISMDAVDEPAWHRPLVERSNLSVKTMRRIATFVSAALVERLIKVHKLPDKVESELRANVRQRIELGELPGDKEKKKGPAPDERAAKLFATGKLTEDVVLKAIKKGDSAFVRHALVHLSGLGKDAVVEMLKSDSGKTVASLAWKAGLSMETAELVQRRVAHVTPKNMIADPGTGTYPMGEDDMEWYLSYFE